MMTMNEDQDWPDSYLMAEVERCGGGSRRLAAAYLNERQTNRVAFAELQRQRMRVETALADEQQAHSVTRERVKELDAHINTIELGTAEQTSRCCALGKWQHETYSEFADRLVREHQKETGRLHDAQKSLETALIEARAEILRLKADLATANAIAKTQKARAEIDPNPSAEDVLIALAIHAHGPGSRITAPSTVASFAACTIGNYLARIEAAKRGPWSE